MCEEKVFLSFISNGRSTDSLLSVRMRCKAYKLCTQYGVVSNIMNEKELIMNTETGKGFESITAYRCNYCGELFHTNNRHHCRYNPDNRSCYSCRYMEGIQLKECQITDEDLPFGEPACESVETQMRRVIRCKNDETVNLDDLRARLWKLNCKYWKSKEGSI